MHSSDWDLRLRQDSLPKLHPMLTTILLRGTIKADGNLPRLQLFWLDTVAMILESAEAGELIPEHVYSAAQLALVLLGNG